MKLEIKTKKYSAIFGGLIFLGLFLFSTKSIALAQSEELKSAKNDASQTVSKILDLKNQNLTDKEKGEAELSLKKEALGKIISLLDLELKEASLKIQDISEIEPEVLIIKDNLTNKIEDFSDQLSGLKKEVDENKDLVSLNAITDKIIKLKEESIDEAIKISIDLSILYENEKVIKIADQRFTKITNLIKKLEFTADVSKKINQILKDSLKLLKESKDLNATAITNLILESKNYQDTAKEKEIAIEPNASTTTVSTSTATTTISISAVAIVPEEEIKTKETALDVKGLVQLSLGKMKLVYKGFISIAEIVNKK